LELRLVLSEFNPNVTSPHIQKQKQVKTIFDIVKNQGIDGSNTLRVCLLKILRQRKQKKAELRGKLKTFQEATQTQRLSCIEHRDKISKKNPENNDNKDRITYTFMIFRGHDFFLRRRRR